MKVRKNVEAVFLVVAVCATWAAYATAETPVVRPVSAAPSAVVVNSNMHVVVVKAKRLTPAEKAALN
jgi:hypothetical protein